MALLLDPKQKSQLDLAVEILRRDIPVALPTETVYGLAARVGSEKALARIFALKARPHFDPLILHVLGKKDLERWVTKITGVHEKLIDAFWPGPLTLLFEKKTSVPDLCTAGSPWVACRSPSHAVFRAILEQLDGEALAAPSANRFTSISPTTSQAVLEELGPWGLEAVVEGGRCERGLESSILKIIDANTVQVLRPGSIAIEALQKVLGPQVKIQKFVAQPSASSVEAPGQLELHYAPKTPLYYFEDEKSALAFAQQQGSLSGWTLLELFAGQSPTLAALGFTKSRALSSAQSLEEAAQNLFSTLRELDAQKPKAILALMPSSEGLGLAIQDRLRRASSRDKKLSHG